MWRSKRTPMGQRTLMQWGLGLLLVFVIDASMHVVWARAKAHKSTASSHGSSRASSASSDSAVDPLDQVGRTFFELRNAAMHNDYAKVQRNRARLQQSIFAADADYYELSLRLKKSDAITLKDEVMAFIAAHKKEFVADRLMQDWMRVLGARQDFAQFLTLYDPVRDERNIELGCYRLLARIRSGDDDVLVETRVAMSEFKKNHQGCVSLLSALLSSKKMTSVEMWSWAQYFLEKKQTDEFLVIVSLLGVEANQVQQLLSHPENLLERMVANQALGVLALTAYSRAQPEKALEWVQTNYSRIPESLQGQVNSVVALRMSLTARAEAHTWWQKVSENTPLTQFQQEWRARAAVHQHDWKALLGAIAQMPENLRNLHSWVYWRGYALNALGQDTEVRQKLWEKIAEEQGFYPDLARLALHKTVSRTTLAYESDAFAIDKTRFSNALNRIQSLQAMGLYMDMINEWRWLMRDLDEPHLLALARQSCERNMIDRCIAASQRTKKNINWLQRYPFPFKKMVDAEARSVGVSVPFIYGIMRQESRFVTSAYSSVGAQGLMQLMPQTAALTARQYRVPFRLTSLSNPDVNVRLGVRYVKTVLDQFKGSWILAAAAYNAGPGRARKWQNSFDSSVDGAIFVETIPFDETRDYVKSVVHSAWVYGALLEQKNIPLNEVLGEVKPFGI